MSWSSTSRGRTAAGPTGRPARSLSVGSTVDVENATWTTGIGAPELIAVWKDLLRPRRSGRSTTPK